MAYSQKGLVGCQVAIASRLAPTIGPSASGRDWLAVRPPSQASQLPQLDRVHPREIGWLLGRHRRQASSHNWTEYIRGRLVGCQVAIASKLSSYNWAECIRGRLVGWQAAFAGKPRSYRLGVRHPLFTTH